MSVCFENVLNSYAFKNAPKLKAKHGGTGKESMIRLMSYANHLSCNLLLVFDLDNLIILSRQK